MSFTYHPATGLLVTVAGHTIALPDMSITSLQKHVRELEAFYG